MRGDAPGPVRLGPVGASRWRAWGPAAGAVKGFTQGRTEERGWNFPFLVIVGTVPGGNWSVRADGNFEVGPFMGLFAFSSVVSVGPLAWIKFPWLKPVA